MNPSYWTKFTNRRIGRRRALIGAGGAAAAAAFLAACGGDDDDAAPTSGPSGSTGGGATGGGGAAGGGAADPGGILTQVNHVSPGDAPRGGTMQHYVTAEPRSLDPVNPQADLEILASPIYEALLSSTPGKLEAPDGSVQGSIAESWETSGDGLRIVLKLRKGVKFHNRPPVNGRELDADDVLKSMEYHKRLAPLQALVWNEISPGGFIKEASAPDSSTVVLDLAEPLSYALNWLSIVNAPTGSILIYPKEFDGGFDIRQDMIGTGPFSLKEHEPSVRFSIERNAEYWDKDWALVDEVQLPILPEYASRQVQLQAGEIYYARHNNILRAEDVLPLKDARPDLNVYTSPMVPNANVFTFGWLPVETNPYRDERVRRAISMSIDRDLDIDVRYNVKKFEEAGIPVRTAWNSHLGARDEYAASGFYIDPQGSDFGPNAQYFQYNLPEAKKMLAAAGHPNGFDVKFGYPNAPQFDQKTQVEPYTFYWQELGLNVIDNGYTDYTQGYIPLDRDASGEFEGIGFHSVTGGVVSIISPESALVAEHLPSSGVTFHGYSSTGSGDKSGDPEVISMLGKAKVEQDINTRKTLIQETQRYLAGKMYNMLLPGGSTGYWLAWPAVGNFPVWQGAQTWELYQLYLDPTKKPIA